MAIITSKAYDTLLTTIEQLTNDENLSISPTLSANLNKKELKDLKKELELLRKKYLQQQKQAQLSYAEFETKFKAVHQQLSDAIVAAEKSSKIKRGYIPM